VTVGTVKVFASGALIRVMIAKLPVTQMPVVRIISAVILHDDLKARYWARV
jgi:hypothetical protein